VLKAEEQPHIVLNSRVRVLNGVDVNHAFNNGGVVFRIREEFPRSPVPKWNGFVRSKNSLQTKVIIKRIHIFQSTDHVSPYIGLKFAAMNATVQCDVE
jgi:hypothetical protein